MDVPLSVSVAPQLNEEKHLAGAVGAVVGQEHVGALGASFAVDLGHDAALANARRLNSRWSRVVPTQHKDSVNGRHRAAPTALEGCAGGLVGGFSRSVRFTGAADAVGFGVGGPLIARHVEVTGATGVSWISATMHGAPGWGFLAGQPDQLFPEGEPA